MTLSPPVPQFLWDIITGGAPVNGYSILGFEFLLLGYVMYVFVIVIIIFLFCWIIFHMEDFISNKEGVKK